MSLIPLGVLSAAGTAPSVIPFPTGITSLVARYDAQDLSSISLSGSDVTQWNDLSGNGHHATQGTSTNRPKSGTRTLNGKNVLDFDGTNDYLSNDSVSASFTGEDKPFTIFMVLDKDVAANAPFGFGASANNLALITLYDSTLEMRDNAGSTSYPAVSTVGTGSKYLTLRSSGLSFTAWINATQVNAGTSYNLGSFSLTRSTIGALIYGTPPPNIVHFLNGAIGEIIYYNRELTTGEVGQVHDYLSSRWGI